MGFFMDSDAFWTTTLSPEELQKGAGLGPASVAPLPDTAFNPDGRYFISYRSVDGRPLADEMQTRLRAAGLSAWRDDADLTLGQIRKRLEQALTGTGPFAGSGAGRRGGLAGAVLIATPQVWTSAPVRHIEAPIILQLAGRHHDDGFELAIANALPSSSDGPADMTQIDEVYGLDADSLSGYLVHDATNMAGRERIVRHLLEKRVERRIENLAEGQPFQIDVDTRQPLRSTVRPSRLSGTNDLVVRLHQHPEFRWPAREALDGFATAMADLKVMIEDGVDVQISGRIHPTVALALGATFSARRPGQVIVCLHDSGDGVVEWRSDAPTPAAPRGLKASRDSAGDESGDKVLVTILATCTPTDQRAFDDLAKRSGFRAIHRIELDRWDPIRPGEGNDLAKRLAARLAALGSQGNLHVAFVGPWALAVLLGHHLNTTNYVSYEWDNNAPLTSPEYQACLRINPGTERHLTVASSEEEKP